MVPPEREPAPCPNCGHPEPLRYCPRCGQDQRSPLVTLSAFLRRAAADWLSFDTRLARTLRSLRRPGSYSADFVAGRRARHLPPVRVYVLVSLLYFATLELTDASVVLGGVNMESAEGTELLRTWLPYLMFLVMPLFGLLLWALYRRRRDLLAEHMVFALEFHTVFFLAFTVLAVYRWGVRRSLGDDPRAWWLAIPDLLLQLAPFVYLYLGQRRFYDAGRLAAVGKSTGLLVGQSLLLGAAVGLLLAVA